MAYMRKNVNMLLAVLVLIVLLSLVILTAFYQQTYRNVTESYEATADELSKISQNFTSKLRELNRTTTELMVKSTDKEQLDRLYLQLEAGKNKLEVELKATQEKLAGTMSILKETEAELSDAKYTIIKNEEDIAMLDSAVKHQKKQLDELRATNCELNKQINPEHVC